MKTKERLIIYPLLALLALATLTDLRPTQAQREPGQATFSKLTIVDQRGQQKITLGVEEGRPVVGLYDPQGKPRATLWVDQQGDPVIGLADKNGKGRMGIRLADGVPLLTLRDEDAKARAMITMIGGQPWLVFNDEDGRRRVTLRTTSEGGGLEVLGGKQDSLAGLWVHRGEPNLAIVNQDTRAKAILAFVRGEPTLALFNKKEHIAAELSVLSGEPSLTLFDQDQKLRAVLGSIPLESTRTGIAQKRPVSSLVLFDEDGRVIWKVP